MAYLEHPLPLTLLDNARQHMTFFAKVFDGRPRDLPLAEQEQWREQNPKIQEAFQKAVDTSSKPSESVTLMFNAEGAFLFVTYRKYVSAATPKTTVGTLLSTLLPKAMLDTVLEDIKPLSEVDTERITSMRTLTDCAPPSPTQPKEASAATSDLLQSTGTSLTEKIAAFTEDVAPDPEDEPGNNLALLNRGPTTVATREKEQ